MTFEMQDQNIHFTKKIRHENLRHQFCILVSSQMPCKYNFTWRQTKKTNVNVKWQKNLNCKIVKQKCILKCKL